MAKTRDEKRAYYKAYYAEHKTERKEYQRGRRKKRKKRTIKAQAYITRRRRIEALEVSLTVSQWDAILERFSYHCVYCGRSSEQLEGEGGLQQDHWVPVVRGGAYTEFNIVPSCRKCNMRKGTKSPGRYMSRLGRCEEVGEMDVKAPCPFCGSTKVVVKRGGRYLYWCVCVKCGADGPPGGSATEATERWNAGGEVEDDEPAPADRS